MSLFGSSRGIVIQKHILLQATGESPEGLKWTVFMHTEWKEERVQSEAK